MSVSGLCKVSTILWNSKAVFIRKSSADLVEVFFDD